MLNVLDGAWLKHWLHSICHIASKLRGPALHCVLHMAMCRSVIYSLSCQRLAAVANCSDCYVPCTVVLLVCMALAYLHVHMQSLQRS